MLVSRLAIAVATLSLFSSIPAAGQAPKLSSQQLNAPTLIVNKPITPPKAYSPNLTNAVVAKPLITAVRPVPEKQPRAIVSQRPSSPDGSQLDMINVQDMVNQRQQAVQQTPKILHNMNDGNCIQCVKDIK